MQLIIFTLGHIVIYRYVLSKINKQASPLVKGINGVKFFRNLIIK